MRRSGIVISCLVVLSMLFGAYDAYALGAGKANALADPAHCAAICRCDMIGADPSSIWCGSLPITSRPTVAISPSWMSESARYYSINSELISESYCYTQCMEEPLCFNNDRNYPGPKKVGATCKGDSIRKTGDSIACTGEFEGCFVGTGVFSVCEKMDVNAVAEWAHFAFPLLQCRDVEIGQLCSTQVCSEQLQDPAIPCRNGAARDANGCCDADGDGLFDETRSPQGCLPEGASWDGDDSNAGSGSQTINFECAGGYAAAGFEVEDGKPKTVDGKLVLKNPNAVPAEQRIKLATVRDWWGLFCQSSIGKAGADCVNGYWGTTQGVMHMCLGLPNTQEEVVGQKVGEWIVDKAMFDKFQTVEFGVISGANHYCRAILSSPLSRARFEGDGMGDVSADYVIAWIDESCSGSVNLGGGVQYQQTNDGGQPASTCTDSYKPECCPPDNGGCPDGQKKVPTTSTVKKVMPEEQDYDASGAERTHSCFQDYACHDGEYCGRSASDFKPCTCICGDEPDQTAEIKASAKCACVEKDVPVPGEECNANGCPKPAPVQPPAGGQPGSTSTKPTSCGCSPCSLSPDGKFDPMLPGLLVICASFVAVRWVSKKR